MNVLRCLIRECILYKFDLGHNAAEAKKWRHSDQNVKDILHGSQSLND